MGKVIVVGQMDQIMTVHAPRHQLGTHEVVNQPSPIEELALWVDDQPLRAWVERFGGAKHAGHLSAAAARLGTDAMIENGRLANRYPPELCVFDRAGRRIDEVRFHPAYHSLMTEGMKSGYSSLPWTSCHPGGHVAHAALVYLLTQVEPGVCCPLTMTYAAIPVLKSSPEVGAIWAERGLAARYDPQSRPASAKEGVTIGMAMTEKQGGSDVQSNQTQAIKDGDVWRLIGHKWFCSAPMSDAFLSLAQEPEGLSCFLVPRWTPDGGRNPIHLMRLKDKLGNRANASAEIEFHEALAFRLGEPGQGVRTIIDMVHHTRLDTAMAPAGLMRRALIEAAHWCRHRRVFQRRLIEQPLMRAVLADLALDWLAALAIGLRTAHAYDLSAADPAEAAFARLAVAIAKFNSNKRCPGAIYEAMECIGGAGYIEDGPMPWLYREAPLNSIWEGSGNVICLDTARTASRQPAAMDALRAELAKAAGADRTYDLTLQRALDRWSGGIGEAEARRFCETIGTLLQASLLLRLEENSIAEAYIAARLGPDAGKSYGTLPAGVDVEPILQRI